MQAFVGGWTIKQKLRVAFGAILSILLAVSLAALYGAQRTADNTSEVVDRIQPAAQIIDELVLQIGQELEAVRAELTS